MSHLEKEKRMDSRNRRNQPSPYTAEQVKSLPAGSGTTVESELDADFIIFCPFHNNHRTPAAEVHKTTGMFFCFSCQKSADLIELVMHTSGRTYFEAARFIKSKEKASNLATDIDRALIKEEQYKPFDELIIKRLHNNLVASDRAKNYFQYRKLTKQSCVKFSLGYSEKQDMVTVPVHSPDGIKAKPIHTHLLFFFLRKRRGNKFALNKYSQDGRLEVGKDKVI
jgi:hypothetical protein